MEVQQYFGEDSVCVIVMDVMDGLVCGMEVQDIGEVIVMFVGFGIKGCFFNVVGMLIDGIGVVVN